ncbi:unnamed protein product [Mycena citricolor]|uniref:Complex 1 LYR protein domain-containing protein n=1 Tax=Mycena citricolor TaxID=2018698 RepID=A0AAD2GUT1_9AGAR|nr:unnamed protein product [Mycena citricolor]
MSTTPTQASVAFRANLARLVSPLRRVRPRVPFFKLAIHRVPTLSLYRNLLRHAPHESIRWRVSTLFRRYQNSTGTEETRKGLNTGYKLLDAFKRALGGDERQRAILQRYSRLINAKREKEDWKRLVLVERAEQIKRRRSRWIMTGALMRATLFNPPLPRIKPQPLALSYIIRKRKNGRTRRLVRIGALDETLLDIQREADSEYNLLQDEPSFEPVFHGFVKEWSTPLETLREEVQASLQRDYDRVKMPVTAELRDTLRSARRAKIANKTRERVRERAGEILPCTIRRARQGPPAHVLVHMTAAQRHADRVVRGVSEVGYVGMMKLKKGFKLRDDGKGIARENSTDLEGERLERLKAMERAFAMETNKRQQKSLNV